MENNQGYEDILEEINQLNIELEKILKELTERGIETDKVETKQEPMQESESRVKDTYYVFERKPEKFEQLNTKIKDAGKIALGLGILGAEFAKGKAEVGLALGTLGVQRAIKGAKTLHTKLKSEINKAALKTLAVRMGVRRQARAKLQQGKENVKEYVGNKKEQVKNWVEDKKEIYEATKDVVKEKKDQIVSESKQKAEEFIDNSKQAKDRFDQRKNKTILGTVRGVKNIAAALEGKLEDRILTDREKAIKIQRDNFKNPIKNNDTLEIE